jgi:hypothetical protein
MHNNLLVLQWTCLVICGAALLVWARALSVRYNDWTTRIRERHPQFNPPPTPEWRQKNTEIMTWLFRIVGAIFSIVSTLALISIWNLR